MNSRPLASIFLSLIMLTGVTAGSVAFAEDDEIELKGILSVIDDNTFELETRDGIETLSINDDTVIDNGLSLRELDGLVVDVDAIIIDDVLFATEIEFEGDEVDDDRDDKHLDRVNEKQDKAEEKRLEKQDKAEEKRLEKQDKAEEKRAKAQERLAEKLTKLETKLTEKAKLSEERANKILEKIEKETQKTEKRLQKLLDKYQSGKYFGNLKNKDAITKSFTLSFEGEASEIGDSSNVNTLTGELYLENQVTGHNAKKFRVTGGEIIISEIEVYDMIFGKARISSSGPGGDKDSMIVIAQSSNGVDVRTLKLSIDLSESFDSETESANITILSPQSKIAREWFLSGTGSLGLTESEEPVTTQNNDEPIETPNTDEPVVDEIEDIPHTTALLVSVSQESYVSGDEIIISGTVEEIFENTPVILQTVTASDLIDIAQIDVTSSGEFTHSITADGPLWQTSDTYTVKAFYGGNNVAQTTFEFSVE